MPYKSDKQRKWAHTESAKEAGFPTQEFDKASKGMADGGIVDNPRDLEPGVMDDTEPPEMKALKALATAGAGFGMGQLAGTAASGLAEGVVPALEGLGEAGELSLGGKASEMAAPQMERMAGEAAPKLEAYLKGVQKGPNGDVKIWGVKGDPTEIEKLGFGKDPGSVPEHILRQHGVLPEVHNLDKPMNAPNSFAAGGMVQNDGWLEQLKSYLVSKHAPVAQHNQEMGNQLDQIDVLAQGPQASTDTAKGYASGGMVTFPRKEKSGPAINDTPHHKYAEGGIVDDGDDFLSKLKAGTTGMPTFNPQAGLPPAPPPMPVQPPQSPVLAPNPLPGYLDAQKQKLQAYGPEQQLAVNQQISQQRNSLASKAPVALGGLADALMQGVARAGNSNFAGRIQGQQNTQDEALRSTLEKAYGQNKEITKEGMALDQLNAGSPLSASKQQTYEPLLKQLGYTPEQIAGLSAADADKLLEESVKFKDAQAKIAATKGAHANSEADREERRQDMLFQQSKAALDATRGDISLRDAEQKRDAAKTVYNRVSEIEKTGKPLTSMDYIDLLALTYKARAGGVIPEQTLKSMQQMTPQQIIAKYYTMFTGHTAPATSRDVMENLKDVAKSSGLQADKFHKEYMQSHKVLPPDLSPDRRKLLEGISRGQSFADSIGEHEFDTEAEAEAAHLPPGTEITIGGRKARVR